MLKKKDQARTRRLGRNRQSKVPLTYYRSASGQAKDNKSPFTRNKPPARLKNFFFGVLDILVIALLLILFIYSLVVKPEAVVSASSYTYYPASTYQRVAENELQSLGNRNKLTIDETEIISRLRSEFPEIKSARIELPVISQVPKLHLEIAEPAFILKSGASSHIISSEGVVVGQASAFSGLQGLPVVEDQSDFKPEKGSHALSPDSAQFIATIWQQTKKADIPVSSLVLPPVAMELNLRTSDKPYFVKFFLGGDAFLQTGHFLATREQFIKDNITPKEYLDVRVQGKVFYK